MTSNLQNGLKLFFVDLNMFNICSLEWRSHMERDIAISFICTKDQIVL